MLKTEVFKLNEEGAAEELLYSYVSGENDAFKNLKVLEEEQRTKDVLNVGVLGYLESGIISFSYVEDERAWLSFGEFDADFVRENALSSIIPAGTVHRKCKMPKEAIIHTADGTVKTGLKLGARLSVYGYVIGTNKTSVNMFGASSNMYFSKITSRNFVCKNISECRHFKDLKSVLKVLKDKQDVFKALVNRYGYMFTIESASKVFTADQEKLSDKKKAENAKYLEEINKILDDINGVEVEEFSYDYGELPTNEIATEEEMKAEAEKRMKAMNLEEIVLPNFKQGKLFFSEFGGILYDLNENAKKAIENLKSTYEGVMPYHIVRSNSNIGDVYMILYVSPRPDEWEYERMSNDNIIDCYGYNATCPMFSEHSSCRLQPANGGLSKI